MFLLQILTDLKRSKSVRHTPPAAPLVPVPGVARVAHLVPLLVALVHTGQAGVHHSGARVALISAPLVNLGGTGNEISVSEPFSKDTNL